MDLTITQAQQDSVTVITPIGDIDVYTSAMLRPPMREAIATGHVVLSLDGVDFLDSTGLGVIIGAKKAGTAAGHEIAIAVTRDDIMKCFRITGLTKVLMIHATVDDAVMAVKADD